jgi:proteic killer suppression protein
VRIRNIVHKALRRLYVEDSAKGLPAPAVTKLRTMLTFLQDMQDEDELRHIPVWKAHQLTGNRRGTWSLHVTANWRLTFRIDRAEDEICDLDFEDYH